MRTTVFTLVIFACFGLGCQSQPAAHEAPRHIAPATQPVAYIDGKPLTARELQAPLIETAGREVFAEIILARVLEQRLADANLELTDADLAAEKTKMLRLLAANEDDAVRLLRELRRRRGLGEDRFERLLRRNAALRKLVADDVTVSPLAVSQAYEQAHGQRYRARVIVTPTLAAATHVRLLLDQGEPFGDVAVEHSIDASAPAGGLLPLVAAADAGYPKAIRDTLARLEPGEVSAAVSVEGGFAILQLEATIPPDATPIEEVHEALEERVRLQAERLLMDQLARDLIEAARVVVLDGDLNRVWEDAQN